MTIDSLDVQQSQHGSRSGNTEGTYSRFVPNALQANCAGIFNAVKEYFWPTPTVSVPALTGRAIDVEGAVECYTEQGTRYGSTIKCVVLVAAAAGIAATAWWMRSTLYADGDAVEPNGVAQDALSVALATSALIGRRLLSAPTVTNAIANQSVFANASFDLQVDLSQVFSYSGSLPDIRFSQIDDTPLPGWLTLTMSSIPLVLVGSAATTNALDVSVVGNYAYVVGSCGLKIIDLTNKASPFLVGSAAISGASGISVIGNYAYVADGCGLSNASM